MTSKQHPIALAAVTLVAGLMAASSAQAVDWGGYFRAGPGATKKDAARACYALGQGSAGMKYRLGNECDFYGEFTLSQTAKSEGVEYKALLMTNLHNAGTDTGGSKVGINQMYAEGKGFDIAPNTTFWVGKRFHGRADVHIVDTFFVNLSGVGAGAEGINLGAAKLGVSYFRQDDTADAGGVQPANRFNFDFSDIPVNPDGKLRVTFTGTQTTATDGESGFGVSLQHNQAKLFSPNISNTAWLQVATGSAGLDGNFGNGLAASGTKSIRFVESVNWQLGKFGGQAMFLVAQQKSDAANSKIDSLSFGGRASYAITNNFKMVSEIGYSQAKPEATDTQKLAKFTIAPTLSTGPGFWNRPELRLYVTTAKWNNAANTGSGGSLTGIGDGATSGTSYGAQVEMWF